MDKPQPRTSAPHGSRIRPLTLSLAFLLLGASSAHGQTTPAMAPRWATPVDDVTGQPAHVMLPAAASATPPRASRDSGTATSTGGATPGAFSSTESTAPPSMGHTSAHGDLAYAIPAGTMLSRGLAAYVKRFGWSMRWNIPGDYMLDAQLPIPAGSMAEGVAYVIRAYQAQGGMLGDEPVFAQPNKIVVIKPTSVQQESK